MREIKTHLVDGDLPQNQLTLHAIDQLGPGGANHAYQIDGTPSTVNIQFQKGPINENGLNGITNEILLAIVIDRLEKFQEGPFPCVENNDALRYCKYALRHLQIRTQNRLQRGVEGKMEK